MLGKFYLMDVEHGALSREVNQPGVSPLFRARGFLHYLASVLRFFEKHASLKSIKLICGVTPEINKEVDVDIRLRHHISIITDGEDIGLGSTAEQLEFVMNTLPYHTLGTGIFEVKREQASVQEYLELTEQNPEHERRYKALLNELAENMDFSVSNVRVYHDLGYRSSDN